MRLLALSGPLAAVLLLTGLFESNIETSSGDRAIGAWLNATGNGTWMVHATLSVLGGIALLVYGQVLRHRTGGHGLLGRTVGSLSTLVATLVVVGGALFAAVPVGRYFESAPNPDPSVYRYLLAASASVLVIFLSLPAAALCAAASAAGLSAHALPRWLGWTGVVLAILMMLSAFVAPLMIFGVWLVVSGIALALDRRSPVTAGDRAGNGAAAPSAVPGSSGRAATAP
jgi:hypothetical protein